MIQQVIGSQDSSVAFERDAPTPAHADSATQAFTVAVRPKPADWLTSSIQRLNNLLALPANWDSYGGKPVDERSAQTAQSFLAYLCRIQGIPEPSITASPDGHIGMTWDFGQTTLEVDVQPNGRFHYVYLVEADEQQDREETVTDPAPIIGLLTRL